MKLIDLLVKLANGEEMPNKIVYNNSTLKYDKGAKDYERYYGKYLFEYKFKNCINFLNDEVEVIKELNLYDTVRYNNYEWFIIGKKEDNVTLLLKECLNFESEIFDEDNDVQFNSDKTNNDWQDSNIRRFLNEEFLKDFNKNELNEMTTNYDEDKHSKDYVRLLTVRNAEKLPKEIRKCDKAYWTMSPSQFSAWNAAACVWLVNSDGTLYYNWTSNSWLGVRPVINLKSEYLKDSQN